MREARNSKSKLIGASAFTLTDDSSVVEVLATTTGHKYEWQDWTELDALRNQYAAAPCPVILAVYA